MVGNNRRNSDTENDTHKHFQGLSIEIEKFHGINPFFVIGKKINHTHCWKNY